MEELISTRTMLPSMRVSAWNVAASQQLSPMIVVPKDAWHFEGEMRRAELINVRALDINCAGATVERSASHVAQTRDTAFTLDLQLTGHSIVRQAGREARLSPGDFVITDNTRPHRVDFDEPVSMRLLRVPASLFRQFVCFPEELVGIRVDGNSGTGMIASRFIGSLWDSGTLGTFVAGVSHVERATLELISGALAACRDCNSRNSSLISLHRVQIVEYIECHLGEPTLTPARVAAALRISLRYVHRIFNNEAETVGRYILRRRLEKAAERLLNALHSRCHISDIAYDCGFASLAHFSRTFRDHYGVSPGEFREAGMQKK